jgi:hypothetical protein
MAPPVSPIDNVSIHPATFSWPAYPIVAQAPDQRPQPKPGRLRCLVAREMFNLELQILAPAFAKKPLDRVIGWWPTFPSRDLARFTGACDHSLRIVTRHTDFRISRLSCLSGILDVQSATVLPPCIEDLRFRGQRHIASGLMSFNPSMRHQEPSSARCRRENGAKSQVAA